MSAKQQTCKTTVSWEGSERKMMYTIWNTTQFDVFLFLCSKFLIVLLWCSSQGLKLCCLQPNFCLFSIFHFACDTLSRILCVSFILTIHTALSFVLMLFISFFKALLCASVPAGSYKNKPALPCRLYTTHSKHFPQPLIIVQRRSVAIPM